MRSPAFMAVVLCAALLALPAAARANGYTFVSCGDPDTHRMTGRAGLPPGWRFSESQPGNWSAFASCSTTAWGGGSGFGFRTAPVGGRVPLGQWAQLTFDAPPDTSVWSVRVARALRRPYPSPFVVPMLAQSPADWCHTYWDGCTVGNYGDSNAAANVVELGTAGWFQLYCDGGQGCPRDGVATWHVFGARIALVDNHAPTFATAPTGLLATGPLDGTPQVAISGADRGGGLLKAEVLAGDTVLGAASFDANGRCDTSFRTDPVPCPLSGSRTVAAETEKVADGDYSMSVRLTDVAGNATSYPLGTRSIDNTPGAPALNSRSAWLNAQEAGAYSVAIGAPPGAGIAGYAVTYDGSAPGTVVNAPADAHGDARFGPPPGGWPEGRVVIKARTVTTRGTGSSETASATFRVDTTAPTVAVGGAGNPSDWQPAPVTLSVSARDGGSGMGAAEEGQPVESGGHIAYELDGAPPRKVAGDDAAILVEEFGSHTLTFRAYDAAGNVSADGTVVFAVGRPQSALAEPNFGFWARTANPGTTFTAAASFGSACPTETTLTPSRDTYVDEARPDQSLGTASDLALHSSAAGDARALLAFDLPPRGDCRVSSAKLRVHSSAATAGRVIQAYRASGSWGDEVTWATRPGAVGVPAVAESGTGWVEFDVTSQVEGIYAHGDDGLLLRDASEGAAQPTAQAYGSREGVPGERPQLIVGFE